jgi:replicative DNA helicase
LAQQSETREPRRSRGRARPGDPLASARAIPADHEAERAVIGAILLDHDALYKVQDRISAAHFDDPRYQTLYDACVTIAAKGQAVTLITLKSFLEERDLLERAGGLEALVSLAEAVPTAAHIEQHARIVRDKGLARQLIRQCEEIAARGYDGGTSVQELIEDAERKVLQVAMGHVEHGFSGLRDELQGTFDYIERLQAGKIVGVQTGFERLDKLTGGLSGGDLVVLAARPGMGKTALALSVARNCAVDYSGCVGIFSLEMTKRQLILRLLMAEAEIDFSRFRNGVLGNRDWPRLTRAADVLSDAKVYIDDTGVLSVTDIAAKARRLHREHHLTLLVIDYLQLVQGRAGSDRREQEVAETTRSLKMLAKDLDLPVILLSQLNRGPETRPNKRPLLADLRESGAIEQDADMVVFIYRDKVYNEDTPDPGVAELIIAKQRNGPTGTIKLMFEEHFARFRDLSEREPPAAVAGFDPGPFGRVEEEPPF